MTENDGNERKNSQARGAEHPRGHARTSSEQHAGPHATSRGDDQPDECENDGNRHGSSLHDVEMPGVEPASRTNEHAGEPLVILESKTLDADDQAFESERDRVADDEREDPDHGPPSPSHERRCGRPYKSLDRGVHQPERGETCERDEVGTDPNHSIED